MASRPELQRDAPCRSAGIRRTNFQLNNKIMSEEQNNNEPHNPAFLQGAVMPRYLYKDGSDVRVNDIVFYSEDGGDHKFHYADSIGMIVKRGNDLKMKSYVSTMDDAKTFQYYEETRN
jgi:6-phosphogluconolactonase (cycloisomerase 2 family)